MITGLETNPLRVSGDGPDGFFTQLQLDGGVNRSLSPSVALYLDGSLRGRLHESGVTDADNANGDVRFGASLTPRHFARGRFGLSTGGLYSAYRGTFTDRETGGVYEVNAIPGGPVTTIPIPDRLNFDTAGLFLNAFWTQSRRLRFFVETTFEYNDYVEDYEEFIELDSLDHRTITVEPGASIRINDAIRVWVSVVATDLDYDERPALDADGGEAIGTTRTYRYYQLRTSLRVRLNQKSNLVFGVRGADRQDTYQGFYDYRSQYAFLSFDRQAGRRGSIRLYASLQDRDYDNATVSGDPEGTIRGNETHRLIARYERTFLPKLLWFAEGGTQQTDSRDTTYAYDRDWVVTGINFRP